MAWVRSGAGRVGRCRCAVAQPVNPVEITSRSGRRATASVITYCAIVVATATMAAPISEDAFMSHNPPSILITAARGGLAVGVGSRRGGAAIGVRKHPVAAP